MTSRRKLEDRERLRAAVWTLPGQTTEELADAMDLTQMEAREALRWLQGYGSVEEWDDGEGPRWFPNA